MSWQDDDGHELSISSVFADGMTSVGSQGKDILVGTRPMGSCCHRSSGRRGVRAAPWDGS